MYAVSSYVLNMIFLNYFYYDCIFNLYLSLKVFFYYLCLFLCSFMFVFLVHPFQISKEFDSFLCLFHHTSGFFFTHLCFDGYLFSTSYLYLQCQLLILVFSCCSFSNSSLTPFMLHLFFFTYNASGNTTRSIILVSAYSGWLLYSINDFSFGIVDSRK